MNKENKTSDKQQNGNDFIAYVSTRFFGFEMSDGCNIHMKGAEASTEDEALVLINKKYPKLFYLGKCYVFENVC